jgi:hypothetical protein
LLKAIRFDSKAAFYYRAYRLRIRLKDFLGITRESVAIFYSIDIPIVGAILGRL